MITELVPAQVVALEHEQVRVHLSAVSLEGQVVHEKGSNRFANLHILFPSFLEALQQRYGRRPEMIYLSASSPKIRLSRLPSGEFCYHSWSFRYCSG